ncbi:ATP-binding protein [Stutzerimonas tarimensis]|uniref:histidine kinase n=1 Tax=Stutzerimonas tarimensis TaxID=1507735 RepID=A0ABV7T735_9GAMM
MKHRPPVLLARVPNWLLHHRLSSGACYLWAVLLIGASALVRDLLPVMGLPYLMFIPVLMGIGFVLGLRAGLLATFVAALEANILFVGERFSLDLTAEQWAAAAFFLLVCSGIVAVCAALRKSFCHLQDLTETLEQRVDERTRERDQIWSMSPDLLATCAADGAFIKLNPAWEDALGWRLPELAGQPFMARVHPEDLTRTAESVASLEQAGILMAFENRYRHRDGSYRWLSWNAVRRGKCLYVTARDVSEEKARIAALDRAEDQLRQSQKMEAVGQLTGGLAHDFNNLLAGISGSLELVTRRMRQNRPEDAERYVQSAMSSANRAAALTHRLLAFSRRQTLDPRTTDVNRLVQGMYELIARTAGPEIRVQTRLQDDLWSMRCDRNQLESALLNLCINARDALPDGGELAIATANLTLDGKSAADRAATPGDYVVLSVTDNGTGMTAEVQARAFDPFFTTKPIGMGTGLGLSMIYGFAQQSGGQALIESAPGMGTTVRLLLPRSLDTPDEESAQGRTVNLPRAPDGQTVLVVDDEPMVRMLIVDVLSELGYHALEAGDGADGLAILESLTSIDLLISDVGLPGGMNGRQLADAARYIRPGLKVLFVTGYAEHAVLGDGDLEKGMHVMTKPFSMEILMATVKELLNPADGK